MSNTGRAKIPVPGAQQVSDVARRYAMEGLVHVDQELEYYAIMDRKQVKSIPA